jgi:hypothetical protein
MACGADRDVVPVGDSDTNGRQVPAMRPPACHRGPIGLAGEHRQRTRRQVIQSGWHSFSHYILLSSYYSQCWVQRSARFLSRRGRNGGVAGPEAGGCGEDGVCGSENETGDGDDTSLVWFVYCKPTHSSLPCYT